jgi:Flp pilus assembly protein TadD
MSANTFTLTDGHLDAIAIMGFNLYQQGDSEQAKILFEGLTAFSHYAGFAGLGAIALAAEPPDLETAIPNLNRAAELNPNDPTVRANLGEALLRKGSLEEAAAEFGKSLELDPEGKDPGASRARAILAGLKDLTDHYWEREKAAASIA